MGCVSRSLSELFPPPPALSGTIPSFSQVFIAEDGIQPVLWNPAVLGDPEQLRGQIQGVQGQNLRAVGRGPRAGGGASGQWGVVRGQEWSFRVMGRGHRARGGASVTAGQGLVGTRWAAGVGVL